MQLEAVFRPTLPMYFPPPPPPPFCPPQSHDNSIDAQSKVLADTIVSTLTERFRSEAIKAGGWLTIAEIERLGHELDRKRVQLEAVFRQTFEMYVRARERAAFDHARQYPFDRLLVNTFAELFSPQRMDADGLDRVTRKVLPGFFMAIDRMVPPDKIEEFQERCRKILGQLSAGDERVMDWSALYANADAKELLLDALAAFAPYFEALDKRRNWFLPLVNDNLQIDAEDDWRLTDRGFYNMALAMFSPLRNALHDTAARARLAVHHGAETCQKLDKAVENMWRIGAEETGKPSS